MTQESTFRLGYDRDTTDVAKSVQLVFGHLFRIAAPIVKWYHSDLYHDAMWLREYMVGESFTFLWSVDEDGTLIGTDLIAATRDHKFAFTVKVDDGSTMLKITDLSGLDEASIKAAIS